MRIGNPPPINQSTIAVSGLASPATFTTAAAISITTANYADITALTYQRECIISNTHASASVYVRDQVATTASLGTLLGAGATAVFTTSASLRVTNASGSTVSITVNQTAGLS